MILVAAMIVRNELNRYLPLAVTHLLSFVDEIWALDDGSTDGTFEYLDGNSRVNVIKNSGSSFYEHEGKARQQLYEHVMGAGADYVLSVDADELVADPAFVREACSREEPVYTLALSEVWKADANRLYLRADGLWKERRVPILYRPQPGWHIRDRKLACGREPVEVVRMAGRVRSAGALYHLGWLDERTRRSRHERYAIHDQGNFHQRRHLESILWDDSRILLRPRNWPPSLLEFKDEILRRTGVLSPV